MSSPKYQQNIAPAAVTLLGGGLLALAGLTFVGTVIGLAAATPLLVVFSPVVVPAAVALFFMVSGLVVSGLCGATAAGMFYWVYCYAGVRGVRIIGAERAKEKLANAAHEMKQRIAVATGLGSPAGEDLPPPVTSGGRENNLDRDIAVD
nr:oleosin 1-like [Ipomoea trifida]